ncbi:MAG: DUF4105 domain-containing protein [Gemmatimonadales bacterium]|nr:DUF4105 domain-containing protein [Gemmatimonadales bacterium]
MNRGRGAGGQGGRGVLLALLALAGLVSATEAGAQTAVPLPRRPAAPLGSHLTVYLMTMGPGEQVWERFGHNAIWIHDPVAGTDQAYNYGLFDLGQEDFLPRFVRGEMWYWMAGFPAERYVQSYVRDNRSVWLQELELPPEARHELQEFLRRNELPENRFYHYDYYRDNCSTRVRDAIDRVIGGRIASQTGDSPAGTTYRFHTQRLNTNDPPIFTGLLLALGEGVDRPISVWEEMFLPLAMREHLRRVTVAGPGGAPVPLVKSERTLFESTAPPPPAAPPRWLHWYLSLGVALGAAVAGLGAFRRNRAARLGFAVLIATWGLAVGLAGVVLAGLWGFTDHVMAHRNENLFQVNPLALALVVLGPLAAGGRAVRQARAVAIALAGLAVLGLVLQVLPGLDQVNGAIIALALPMHLGIAMALRRLS